MERSPQIRAEDRPSVSSLRSSRRWLRGGFVLIATASAIVVAASVFATVLTRSNSDAARAWEEHHEACSRQPEEIFHRDRSRAVRGFVRGPDGTPIRGATVRCVRLDALLELARPDSGSLAAWPNLVETRTETDAEGRYEFAHLPEGARTLCASAPGLAPAGESLIVTQDGIGARVDFDLERPTSLRVRFREPSVRPRRIELVPHRWWPDLPAREVAPDQTEVEFTVGGPFRRGLVVTSEPGDPRNRKPVGAYDVSRSVEVSVSLEDEYTVTAADVPEASAVAPWREGTSATSRTFFGLVNPAAIFWKATPPPTSASDLPHAPAWNERDEKGGLRGYTSDAFLPVLVESRTGPDRLVWASDASEFELSELPPGVYRARALMSFGRVSFARGLVVQPGRATELTSRVGEAVAFNDANGREVMGVVRWEDGQPGAGAVLFLQDATSFRRFLKRVEADKNGFFSVPGVPAGRYVAFALPPKEDHAMKPFVYPVVPANAREVWLDLTLSPHRIVGDVPPGTSLGRVELVRSEQNAAEEMVWAATPNDRGRFEIANVPHGRYQVRLRGDGPAPRAVSHPFVVERETVVSVRWRQ